MNWMSYSDPVFTEFGAIMCIGNRWNATTAARRAFLAWRAGVRPSVRFTVPCSWSAPALIFRQGDGPFHSLSFDLSRSESNESAVHF
jgi:hypothetical protein